MVDLSHPNTVKHNVPTISLILLRHQTLANYLLKLQPLSLSTMLPYSGCQQPRSTKAFCTAGRHYSWMIEADSFPCLIQVFALWSNALHYLVLFNDLTKLKIDACQQMLRSNAKNTLSMRFTKIRNDKACTMIHATPLK